MHCESEISTSKTMHLNATNLQHAPGIHKVLGAFLLDIGLLAVFWFAAMIFATAIWVLSVYIANAGTIPNSQPGPLASMLIGVSALYLAITTLWAFRGRQLSVNPTLMTKRAAAVLAVTCGLALCLLTMLCTYVLDQLGFNLRPGNQTLLEGAGKSAPIIVGLFTVMIAPTFEELLFRKQIFARFHKERYVLSAYFLSSVLFAFMHEPQPTQGLPEWGLILMLYAAMGAVFAWVYRRTGRIWPAILTHASNNLLAVGILFLA